MTLAADLAAEALSGPLGCTTPRLWTRPLVFGEPGPCGCGCALDPTTSLGFEAVAFAEEVLEIRLLPWQRFWLIHALELKAPGRFRFRTVLTLVGRQNGKTTTCKILALWFLYVRGSKLVLGAAQDLKIARESWQGAVDFAEITPDLAAEIPKNGIRYANGEQCLTLTSGGRYMITAATRGAGRGLSVDGLLLLDELREQRDWAAWSALSKTTIAQSNALTVGITNQGDDQSVVLNQLRNAALVGTDPQLGLFEYSAPDGCDLDDVDAWAQANPGMGRTITLDAIRAARTTDPATTFRTEVLCQRVDQLDAAVDPAGWRACADPGSTLAAYALQVVVCVDVAYDDHHVTAAGAALDEAGRVHLEILGAWANTTEARVALRRMFERMHPRAVGWFPSGPAAILGADLTAMHGEHVGTRLLLVSDEMRPEAPGVVELTGGTAVAACQTLADLVDNRMAVHPDDPLLNAHITASTRKDQGDGWRFARRGAARNDAAYAAAGAVHLARSLPPISAYDVLESVF